MGLPQEIQMLSNPNAGIIKADAHNKYAPHWLSIVSKKGVYQMSETSLKAEEKSCRKKANITFYEWLEENQLKYKEDTINHTFTIYR